MKESQFHFYYSWDDLRPIRPIAVTVIIAQVVGGLLGLWLSVFPDWRENFFAGGALATFPGFLLGLLVQKIVSPKSIEANSVMVRRFAMIALLLSLVVFLIPFGNGSAH